METLVDRFVEWQEANAEPERLATKERPEGAERGRSGLCSAPGKGQKEAGGSCSMSRRRISVFS